MKQLRKRIVAVICACVMLFCCMPSNAYAAESISTGNINFSEYEYIVSARAMSKEQAMKAGITEEAYAILHSSAIEDELLLRKSKSDEELMAHYGYSAKEIQILRKYEGERLEENPSLAAVTGTLTITTPNVSTATSTTIYFWFDWSWDHKPVVNNTDILAINWSPTFGTQNGNMRIMSSYSKHYVKYTYMGLDVDTRQFSFEQIDATASIQQKFPMLYDLTDAWASWGEALVYLQATEGSAPLTSIDIVIVYGHATLVLSAGVSFPASGGISVSWGTDDACRKSGYIPISTGRWVNN